MEKNKLSELFDKIEISNETLMGIASETGFGVCHSQKRGAYFHEREFDRTAATSA